MGPPAWRAALRTASAVASRSSRSRSPTGASPTMPTDSSTPSAARVAVASSAARSDVSGVPGGAQEPAQLVLGPDGVPTCRHEVVGAPHGREVLEHGVVQPGGALGALGGAGRGRLGLEQRGLQPVARLERALQQLDQPGQGQRPEGEDQQRPDPTPDVPAGGDRTAGDRDHAEPRHGADHVPASPRQGHAGQDDERRPADQRPPLRPRQRTEQLHRRGGQQPPPPPGDRGLDELGRDRPDPQQHDAAPQHGRCRRRRHGRARHRRAVSTTAP